MNRSARRCGAALADLERVDPELAAPIARELARIRAETAAWRTRARAAEALLIERASQ